MSDTFGRIILSVTQRTWGLFDLVDWISLIVEWQTIASPTL